jgi:hypothetical protein
LWYRLLPTNNKNLFLKIKKSTTQIRARQGQIQALSEEEATIGHAKRWQVVVAVERKKSSLSRKVATVVEGGEEEAVVNIPRGRPYAPHRHEHKPAAHLTVVGISTNWRRASPWSTTKWMFGY